MTLNERNQIISAYMRHTITFSDLKACCDEWNQQVRAKKCKECGIYPAEKEGICQGCLDYRSHYGI